MYFPFSETNQTTQGQFTCQGEESGTQFKDIDLSELSWYDYDEKACFRLHIKKKN